MGDLLAYLKYRRPRLPRKSAIRRKRQFEAHLSSDIFREGRIFVVIMPAREDTGIMFRGEAPVTCATMALRSMARPCVRPFDRPPARQAGYRKPHPEAVRGWGSWGSAGTMPAPRFWARMVSRASSDMVKIEPRQPGPFPIVITSSRHDRRCMWTVSHFCD